MTGIVRRRAEWTTDLARVNTGMGLVVLALMLLANSPLLDFRKISVNSQLNRVESGEIELKDFDFWYAKNQLARPGYLALEEIKQEIGDSDPELLRMVNNPVNKTRGRGVRSAEEMWAAMVYRPEPFDVPQSLKSFIDSSYAVAYSGDPVMFKVDLDDDGQSEYLLLLVTEYGIGYSQFYYLADKGWLAGDLHYARSIYGNGVARDAIRNGEIVLIDRRFKHLKIGDVLLQPVEN
ncbi:hypothetical protein MnTg04_01126 [bacterium MnTg04]|nr:hypothetical protein MnTg04_01126 [bacterium MnTg04]